jgi:Leucine-rich repeat (LRR) protein
MNLSKIKMTVAYGFLLQALIIEQVFAAVKGLSSTNNATYSTQMVDLPNELLLEIGTHLPVNDAFNFSSIAVRLRAFASLYLNQSEKVLDLTARSPQELKILFHPKYGVARKATRVKITLDQLNDQAFVEELPRELTTIHFDPQMASEFTLINLIRFKNLKELDLSGLQISDLSPLARLPHLTTLNLSNTYVRDISLLAGLTQLIDLDLSKLELTDLTPLTQLIHLRSLSLIANPITALSPLAGLNQLTKLILTGTQVTDISQISGLSHLRILNLTYTPITDF